MAKKMVLTYLHFRILKISHWNMCVTFYSFPDLCCFCLVVFHSGRSGGAGAECCEPTGSFLLLWRFQINRKDGGYYWHNSYGEWMVSSFKMSVYTWEDPKWVNTTIYIYIHTWLVVWNIFYFPYIGENNPNWFSYFSEFAPFTTKRL